MKLLPVYCFIFFFLLAGYLFKPALREKTPDFPLTLKAVSFQALPGFEKDEMIEALPALERSCTALEKQKAWKKFCTALNQKKFKTSKELRKFLRTEMKPFAVGAEGLFTGYFRPEIEGSLEKTDKFKIPVLGVPENLIQVDLGKFNPKNKGENLSGLLKNGEIVPYLTRREIESGLSQAKPVAWVEHKADLFMMQIQGSGILHLPDGQRVALNYAGHNGHPFYGIGGVLAKKGIHSMNDIRNWLIKNPAEGQKLMHENKRYIFFKRKAEFDTIGSLGVPLTERRSLAVDPAFVPLGSFLWLDTTAPDGKPMQRLVTAQDTGNAIKGPVRGDFFWGIGENALKEAGRMRSKGTYFILLPKDM